MPTSQQHRTTAANSTTVIDKSSQGIASLVWQRRHGVIAVFTLVCIAAYLLLGYSSLVTQASAVLPLWMALIVGGGPLVLELSLRLIRREFGSDLLAGISIVTALLLDQYLAGALVVLMLSGGEALEAYAVRRASSVLDALARRMPATAHRVTPDGIAAVALNEIKIGDQLLVLPHEICPVDGVVVEGHGSMDEAYLTGEPYRTSKSVGSDVLSGAINGEAALTIEATRLTEDSRYARIMDVMEQSQQQRPQMRRLADQLGAFYTPLAVAIAVVAWIVSGDPVRFLAVMVIATPCPLLIAVPVAIIGSVSLAARHSIIIRDPAVLERIGSCRTMIFDKTGTLTYGEPTLVEQLIAPSFTAENVLQLTASLEQYSKHPLSVAVVDAAAREHLELFAVERVQERPGEGLTGTVQGKQVQVTSSKKLLAVQPDVKDLLPPSAGGLECVVLVDGRYAGTYRFRDEPRQEGAEFIGHLAPMHGFEKTMLLSGDRRSEVEYLGERVGITELHADKSPEEKLAIVRAETALAPTVYVGDGINDAPAMVAATVGLAMGQRSEVTTEAADAILMDNQLGRVDQLLHIGGRMRRIALQSAIGGMLLSLVGMIAAAIGYLPPVAGAITQEVIDVAAVFNALRAAWPPKQLEDYSAKTGPRTQPEKSGPQQ
ncbi:heavy metal translocating P-type ATPase [Rubinisphaera brasiliensis]|uniref:P-type Zn(2+) transporter n=1 Tax=Rubinisphaera brasiliensis (strain ATCC 49424 / DSM 5305 / JCM 21570 / IAM 15109 / NBRC 103401 / IFAM 1448) TaxID=756272 RepID=F0SH84_RUBBR|nr:heavy metal translocating P-type ATPase [Rubinisphaera brasiliensis]ADY60625.1 heavy metal translocating P-type ATPase [Rubinisphaera brasiliensis DSM 5305]